jgi:hypothetical protein
MTIVEKILARAAGLPAVKAGEVVEPAVDLAMSHENAALVINQMQEVFKGTGRWNGRDGYSYEVSALENSRQLHRGDIVRITIKSSDGTIVGEVNGRLGGGNVQFFRRPY